MRKILFLVLVSFFLAIVIAVSAQETKMPDPALPAEGLPEAGLTPDSPFYFLKTWKESIQTFFTFGEENKAKQFLHLADVRLAEYQKMIEKGKTEIAGKILEKYENQLNRSLEKIVEIKGKGGDVEKLTETINKKIARHQETLAKVLDKAPDEAKEGIGNAIEMSQKGLNNVIQQMMEGGLKEASPEAQGCIKSVISNVFNKVKSGNFKGVIDFPEIFQDCLPPGTKIPFIEGGGINLELLKKMQEFYGKNLSPKDMETLKKAQEQLKGIIPQGTETPSGPTFDLEAIKKAQEDALKNMSPEELELMKKIQEQPEPPPTETPEVNPNSGGGMGM